MALLKVPSHTTGAFHSVTVTTSGRFLVTEHSPVSGGGFARVRQRLQKTWVSSDLWPLARVLTGLLPNSWRGPFRGRTLRVWDRRPRGFSGLPGGPYGDSTCVSHALFPFPALLVLVFLRIPFPKLPVASLGAAYPRGCPLNLRRSDP